MCQSFGDVRYSERVIQQRGSLKIILETPMLNLNDLNMAARKLVETSGVYFGPLKTFLLSVKLEKVRIGTPLNMLVTQNSKI